MSRRVFVLLAWVAGWGLCSTEKPLCATEIVSEPTARLHGLTRAWFSQVQVDPSRGRIRDLLLDQGTLFVVTDQSVLSAIDAATGQTLWAVPVGRRDHPTLTPAAHRRLVAVVNGSFLYVLNRATGHLLWKAQLDGVPGAGPALSTQRVYVPLLDGRLVAYRLRPVQQASPGSAQRESGAPKEPSVPGGFSVESLRLEQQVEPPVVAHSPGRAVVPPLVVRENEGEEIVVWGTDQGYLCVGRIDRNYPKTLELRYRLQVDAPIVAQPCYLPPDANVRPDTGLIFVAAEDGFVHAICERTGERHWRFSTGEPIIENPVVLGRFVFVTNQLGGMYCLDAKEGKQLWRVGEVTRFLAASKHRVYATDKVGWLYVLDAKTGSRIDRIAADMLPVKLTNCETDRLFLATKTGLVQCLHEPDLVQPLVRRMPPKDMELAGPAKPPSQAAAEAKPAAETVATPSAKPSGAAKASATPRITTPKSGGTKPATKKATARQPAGAPGAEFGPAGAGGKRRPGGRSVKPPAPGAPLPGMAP